MHYFVLNLINDNTCNNNNNNNNSDKNKKKKKKHINGNKKYWLRSSYCTLETLRLS